MGSGVQKQAPCSPSLSTARRHDCSGKRSFGCSLCRGKSENVYSRDLLLRPLQVLAHFPCVLHAFCKASPRSRESSLRLLLQLQQLPVLRVQASRAIEIQSAPSVHWPSICPPGCAFGLCTPARPASTCRTGTGDESPATAAFHTSADSQQPRQGENARGRKYKCQATHVCACVATALSRPSGSKELVRWSCMYSLKSTPLAERWVSEYSS